MSSRDMLDDENKMNLVNPFVTTGPGAWSNPYPFAKRALETPIKEAPEEPSPMCLADISGNRLFGPGTCPLNRPLEPTRSIEPDLNQAGFIDTLYGTPKEAPASMFTAPMGFPLWLLLIAIILLVMWMKM